MSNQKIDSTQVDFQVGANLTVKEADGAPTVSNVDTIVVSNGTLTDDGGGQVTLTTGGGGGTDANAIHVNASGEIAALTSKATPVDADVTVIEDSAASNGKKKLTWANIKATFKTYFDTLYAAGGHSHAWSFDENAQDAVGGILDDSGDIDFTYDDATPKITGAVKSDAVTYAKLQNVSAAEKLLGRGAGGGAGDVEEITLGTNLSMSGTTLNAGGTAVDSDAIHDNVSGEISAITEKTTLVDDDVFLIEDSAASYAKKKVKKSNLGAGGGGYPEQAALWCDGKTDITGTWVNGHDGNCNYACYTGNSPSNNTDEFELEFFIKAGTYTMYVLGIAYTTYGISDIYIDGVEVASFDWYAGSLVYNTVKSQGSITISGDGQHTLRVKVDGKNGSSSDYDIALTKIWFK